MKLASSGCENLSQLSQHLLRSANQEAPLVDFLEQVTQMLLTFCAADTVELWVRRDETWLHFRSATSGPRSFRLETTPSAKAPHQLAGTRIQPYSLSVPIVAGDETVGCVEWRSRRRSYFTPKNARALEEVARALGLTLVSQLAQTALRERVKELTCLYQLAQLAERPEATLQDILAGVVDLLPTAWQYPAIARARVVLDDKVRETPGFLNAVEK